MATKSTLEPKIALEVVDRNLTQILDLCDDSGIHSASDLQDRIRDLAYVARNAARDGKRFRDRSIQLGKGLKVSTT